MLSTVVTQVLNLARQYQIGRVTPEVTFATFNFTEGWFRNSGLYDLCEKYQLALIEAFIADKCKWNNEKVQKEAAKYKRWQEYIELAKETLVNDNDLPMVITMIENDIFKTEADYKKVQRTFKEYIGISPKLYARMLRFEKIHNELRGIKFIDWMEVVTKYNFHDQSHLIKEFKFFTGVTPKIFLNDSENFLQYKCNIFC